MSALSENIPLEFQTLSFLSSGHFSLFLYVCVRWIARTCMRTTTLRCCVSTIRFLSPQNQKIGWGMDGGRVHREILGSFQIHAAASQCSRVCSFDFLGPCRCNCIVALSVANARLNQPTSKQSPPHREAEEMLLDFNFYITLHLPATTSQPTTFTRFAPSVTLAAVLSASGYPPYR